MLIGFICPAAAIPITRARFGRFRYAWVAVVFLVIDTAALREAIFATGDNPFPIMTVELAPVGVIIAVMMVRRRAAPLPKGICTVCGYDLRATPSRCPECGTTPTMV
jgi:hypothetical protein